VQFGVVLKVTVRLPFVASEPLLKRMNPSVTTAAA